MLSKKAFPDRLHVGDTVCMCVCVQVDSQQTLRDLRLQFAEQISLLAAEGKSSDIMETLFRGKNKYWWDVKLKGHI